MIESGKGRRRQKRKTNRSPRPCRVNPLSDIQIVSEPGNFRFCEDWRCKFIQSAFSVEQMDEVYTESMNLRLWQNVSDRTRGVNGTRLKAGVWTEEGHHFKPLFRGYTRSTTQTKRAVLDRELPQILTLLQPLSFKLSQFIPNSFCGNLVAGIDFEHMNLPFNIFSMAFLQTGISDKLHVDRNDYISCLVMVRGKDEGVILNNVVFKLNVGDALLFESDKIRHKTYQSSCDDRLVLIFVLHKTVLRHFGYKV